MRRGLEALRGTFGLAVIAVNTMIVCTVLYPMGLVRTVLPDSRLRRAIGQPMDGLIDAWVAVARAVVLHLGVTRLDVRFPREAEGMDRWNLVISNHQSWADILVLQAALYERIPRLKFFTKRQLTWLPLLGFAMWMLGFPYVYRHSPEQLRSRPDRMGRDREATLRQCKRFHERPVSVLIFAEGTRFTKEKWSRGERSFRHLLRPRMGGMRYVLESLGPKIPTIVDVTIQYEGDVPGFWDFMCGRCRRVDVNVVSRRSPGPARSTLEAWLRQVWKEKDDDLELHGPADTVRPLEPIAVRPDRQEP